MELRYCEECGDVIRAETEAPLSLSDHFICEKCRSGVRGPRKSAEATGSESKAPPINKGELNFFSNETIALRKVQHKERPPVPQAEEKPKSTHLRLVRPESAPSGAEAATSTGQPAAPRKQKILFRCLHCRATLSIRPVDKTSKLACPHCSGTIYVTPSGKLHKTPPPNPLKKGAGLLSEKKEGSTMQYLGVTAPGGESSAALQAGRSRRVVKQVVANPTVPNPQSSRVVRQKGGSQAVPRTGAAPGVTGSSRRLVQRPSPTAGGSSRAHGPSSPADAFPDEEPEESSLAVGDPFAEESQDSATSPDALLPDESDLLDDGDDFASLAAQSFDKDKAGRKHARPQGPLGHVKRFVRNALQMLFLVLCLCGPLCLVSLVAPPKATALSVTRQPVQTSPLLERLQKTGLRGLHRLLEQ